MSAPGIALLPQSSGSSPNPRSWRLRWLNRLAHRCASPQCPHRAALWPSWLRGASGVEFEGRWYCGTNCLRPIIGLRVQSLSSSFVQEKPRNFRIPLGLLLVDRGAISPEQVRIALQRQRDTGRGRIGDWFLQLGMVTDQQLTNALGQQWGCPVFPLEPQKAKLSCADLVPLPLLESAFAVPAHASPDGRNLHIAFGNRVDHTLLYGMEQLLGCQTIACVASGKAIAQVLDHLRRNATREETCFENVRDPREMTAAICSYAEHLRARRVSVARAAAFLWVRFHGSRSSRDLLFRVLQAPQQEPADLTRDFPNPLPDSADKGKDGVSDASSPL